MYKWILKKKGNNEQKGTSWAGLAGRCLASQWYSLLINIHLFSIFTYTWFGTKSLSHYWLIHDLGLSFLAMLMTLRESILWVGFKLTNKLHNFHYYRWYNHWYCPIVWAESTNVGELKRMPQSCLCPPARGGGGGTWRWSKLVLVGNSEHWHQLYPREVLNIGIDIFEKSSI